MNSLKDWQSAADKYQGVVTKLAGVQITGHVCAMFSVIVLAAMGMPVDTIITMQAALAALGVGLMGAAHSVNYMFTLFAIKTLNGADNAKDTSGDAS